MTKKKKALIAVSVLLSVLIIAGVSTVAANNYGSQTDPLITLSYLNTTATNTINDKINQLIESAKTTFSGLLNDKITEYANNINSRLPGATGTDATFSVVSLNKNQKLVCKAGTEIMLRIGTASAYGTSSPLLINITTGSALTSSGAALTTNHMYMVTIDGNGITATASVKVLVRGSYTIS